MTHQHTTTDGIESEKREQMNSRQSSPDGLTAGRLMRGAAAAVLGMTGLGLLTGSATASQNQKRVIVIGDGEGKHNYEIKTKMGGTIDKSAHAGGNDQQMSAYWNAEKVNGELWHWNADSYTYTGELAYVKGDGNVSFHFPDGAFDQDSSLRAEGEASGKQKYAIATHGGDINLGHLANDAENDGGSSSTEQSHTPDWVTGTVWQNGTDNFFISGETPIQNLIVEGGAVKFH